MEEAQCDWAADIDYLDPTEAGYQALEEVHRESRNIIFLRFCGGYKYKEIAEMKAMPLGTVVSRAHRSLHRVRRILSA